MGTELKKLKQGMVFWMTGLSAAGKSSIAQGSAQWLKERGYPVLIMDGDIMRRGLCKDLGFSAADRAENNRRCAEVAKLIALEASQICICAFISPLEDMRKTVRTIIGSALRLIFIDCDLETCIQRDPKGNYMKVQQGLLQGYTGITAPFEPPKAPDFTIHTAREPLSQSVQNFSNYILECIS